MEFGIAGNSSGVQMEGARKTLWESVAVAVAAVVGGGTDNDDDCPCRRIPSRETLSLFFRAKDKKTLISSHSSQKKRETFQETFRMRVSKMEASFSPLFQFRRPRERWASREIRKEGLRALLWYGPAAAPRARWRQSSSGSWWPSFFRAGEGRGARGGGRGGKKESRGGQWATRESNKFPLSLSLLTTTTAPAGSHSFFSEGSRPLSLSSTSSPFKKKHAVFPARSRCCFSPYFRPGCCCCCCCSCCCSSSSSARGRGSWPRWVLFSSFELRAESE